MIKKKDQSTTDKDIKSKLLKDLDDNKVLILERLENIGKYTDENDARRSVELLLKSAIDYFPFISKELLEMMSSRLHNDITEALKNVPDDWALSTPEYEAVLRVRDHYVHKIMEGAVGISILAKLTTSIRKDLEVIKDEDKEMKIIFREAFGYQKVFIYGNDFCEKDDCNGCRECKGIFAPIE